MTTPTSKQKALLRNAADHAPLVAEPRDITACCRHGWLTDELEITDAGRALLASPTSTEERKDG